MNPLKILLVDDQRLFVQSLKQVLESFKDTKVQVSIAYDGKQALRSLEETMVDLVLMDIHMPIMDGIAAIRSIHKLYPQLKILALSAFGYDEYVERALSSGALGYLLKDITPSELLDSVKTVLAGRAILSRELIASVSKDKVAGRPREDTVPAWFLLLTEKERSILKLVSKGYSNNEIAEALFLGKQTVRNYISSIYDKMDVKDRFGAMRMAIEASIESLVP
jgi:DNA-binding NarL/FixJ family response regulator